MYVPKIIFSFSLSRYECCDTQLFNQHIYCYTALSYIGRTLMDSTVGYTARQNSVGFDPNSLSI